jgi:cytochrome c
MKRIVSLSVLPLLVLACFAAFAQEKQPAAQKEMPKIDPAAELAKSVARGKALFSDPKLGTNGTTCNNCHAMGGAVPAKLGDRELPAFDKLGCKYPQYWGGMTDRVMTLEQVVNYCIIHPLAGKELGCDSQEMADLVAYCASVTPMMEKMKAMEQQKKGN